MNKPVLITAVAVVEPGVLEISFDGKKPFRVDLRRDITEYPALAPLSDPALFATAHADEFGHAVRWNDDIDLGADALWMEAHVQAGLAVRFEEFDAWRKRNGLSLTDIANILGVSRRTATNYASGFHLIPKIVGLAMVGWETLKARKAA